MLRGLQSHTLFSRRSFSSNIKRDNFLWKPQCFTTPVKVWSGDVFAILANKPKFVSHCNSDYKGNCDIKNILMLLSNTKPDIGNAPQFVNNAWVNPEHSHDVLKSLPYIRFALAYRFPEIEAFSTRVEIILNAIEVHFNDQKQILNSRPSDLNKTIRLVIGELIHEKLSDDINFIDLGSYTDTELNQNKIGKLLLPEVENKFGKLLALEPFSNNEIERVIMNVAYSEKIEDDTNVFSCR